MRRKNENQNLYKADELMMSVKLYEKTKHIMEVLYSLMKHGKLKSFSFIAVYSTMNDFGAFLADQKRDTDILISIDPAKNIYALLCQETQVDGGYYFMQRLIKTIKEQGKKDTMSASVTAIESIRYEVKDVIFIVLDSFIKLFAVEKENEILFRTLK